MILLGPGRVVFVFIALALPVIAQAQAAPPSSAQSSSSSAKSPARPAKKPSASGSALDSGAVTYSVYRNKTLALSCNIPAGWVLRTDEMNARDEGPKDEEPTEEKKEGAQPDPAAPPPASSAGAKVLLAAFSRPPLAKGEDVNSSILIAAETASSYPGLKEAAQYFGPLIEVAKAQGFTLDENPYDIAIGPKTLVRGDFHKDVGSRVMHQSTLVMLAHGYAISITVIGGTDDEVEDLVDGLSFTASGK